MIQVYILEDDFKQQSRLENIITHYLQEQHIVESSISLHGRPDQLLAEVKEKGNHQIFFLDIEIKNEEKKGLEIARRIREKDNQAVIVFVTTHSELMPLTFQYQVSAFDFIDKNFSEEKFSERIKAALDYVAANLDQPAADKTFLLENDYSRIQMPYKDIYYIEVSATPHKLILHGQYDYMEFYGTLAEVEGNSHFLRVHRSYVVNPANVAKLDYSQRLAYFPNGETCIVARPKIKELIRAIEALHGGRK